MVGERRGIRRRPKAERAPLALGLIFGAGIGVAIGAATDQVGTWLPIGVGAGIAIGAGLSRRAKREVE